MYYLWTKVINTVLEYQIFWLELKNGGSEEIATHIRQKLVYYVGQLFPVPLINIFVNPTGMPGLWHWLAVLDDNPIFGTGLFIAILLLLIEEIPVIPALDGEDEATPAAIKVLCGEYASLKIFEHDVW